MIKEFVFISDSKTDETLDPKYSQSDVINILEQGIKSKKIISSKIIKEQNYTSFAFIELSGEPNSMESRTIIIHISKQFYNDINFKKLNELHDMCNGKVKNVNVSKILKTTGAVLVGGALLVGTLALGLNLLDEGLKKETDYNNERITQQYLDENGNDVREYPTFSDNGYYIDSNHYIDESGVKYVLDVDGVWHEMGPVVNNTTMTQEEYDEYLKENEFFEGLVKNKSRVIQ